MKNNDRSPRKYQIKFLPSLLLFMLILGSCQDQSLTTETSINTEVPDVVTHQALNSQAQKNARIENNVGTGFVNRDASGTLTYFAIAGPCGQVPGSGYRGTVGTGFFYANYFSSDFNGDARTDLICRNSSGSLYFYPWNTTTASYAGGGTNVGNGFNFENYLIGDFNGDGTSDLIGRHSVGDLYFYPFNNNTFIGQGGGQVVGSGFNGYTHYFVADWNNDGRSDLICRTTSGNLVFFPFTSGSFGSTGTVVGNGFAFADYFITENTGDNFPDLVCKDNTGQLRVYPFMNNTFYGNGGGYIVFSGVNYSTYLFKDFSCDDISDFYGIYNTGSVTTHRYFNYQFVIDVWSFDNWNYENYFPGFYGKTV